MKPLVLLWKCRRVPGSPRAKELPLPFMALLRWPGSEWASLLTRMQRSEDLRGKIGDEGWGREEEASWL